MESKNRTLGAANDICGLTKIPSEYIENRTTWWNTRMICNPKQMKKVGKILNNKKQYWLWFIER